MGSQEPDRTEQLRTHTRYLHSECLEPGHTLVAIPSTAWSQQLGLSNQRPQPSKALNLELSLSKIPCPFLKLRSLRFLL